MMRWSGLLAVLAAVGVVAAGPTLGTVGTVSNGSGSSGETVFESAVVGNPPGMTGAAGAIRGVDAAGAPWKVAEGEAELDDDGRLEVEVEGLVLDLPGNPRDGTTGTVTGVRASLTCQGTNVVATTGVVPLSSDGDAEIEEDIVLPAMCVAPIILVRIGSTTTNPGPLMGAWIGATGFSSP